MNTAEADRQKRERAYTNYRRTVDGVKFSPPPSRTFVRYEAWLEREGYLVAKFKSEVPVEPPKQLEIPSAEVFPTETGGAAPRS